MSDKAIRSVCDVKDTLKHYELSPVQGELKTLSKTNFNKLKKEIITEGFAAPLFVYRDHKMNNNLILDGTQRHRVIQYLIEKEGYNDFDIPVVYIKENSLEDAKKRLLSFVSMYGTLNDEGLYSYMFDARIEMNELEERFSLPQNNFDLDKFKAEYFQDAKEDPVASNGQEKKQQECPSCGHSFSA